MITFKNILLDDGEPIYWETLDRIKFLKKLEEKKNLYPNDEVYDISSFKKDLEYQLGIILFPYYTDPNTIIWIIRFFSEKE